MGSTDMASGSEIINGQPAVFTIIANPGFLLNKIVVNGTAVSALPKGALNKDNTISYTYTTASLTASTTLSVGFRREENDFRECNRFFGDKRRDRGREEFAGY